MCVKDGEETTDVESEKEEKERTVMDGMAEQVQMEHRSPGQSQRRWDARRAAHHQSQLSKNVNK